MSGPIRGDAVTSAPQGPCAVVEPSRADLDHLGAMVGFKLAARLDAPASSSARCDHTHAVPVRSVVDDELLAALCPTCDAQLPASWFTCDHASAYESSVDISSLGAPPGRRLCNGCGVAYWPPPIRPVD
ncbi:hypothetical protein [Streptosporangium sp. G12]